MGLPRPAGRVVDFVTTTQPIAAATAAYLHATKKVLNKGSQCHYCVANHNVEDRSETVNKQQLEQTDRQDELVAEDLIEEVSIDGMCGVY